MPNTIILRGGETVIRKEGLANAGITPGHFIRRRSDGKLEVHGDAGQDMVPLIALENELVGRDITQAYATGDQVLAAFLRPGCEVYAFLATANNVAIGDELESDGAGGLAKHTPQAVNEGGSATYSIYTRAVVARALEAQNNTSGSQQRLKVEIV